MTDPDLATIQRGLHGLIKANTAPLDDPYLQRAANSKELEIVRIVLWWRLFSLEAAAPLTAALLKQRRDVEEVIKEFLRASGPSGTRSAKGG